MTAELQTKFWREASKDLGFVFTAPFTLPDQDETLAYLGLVSEFGSKLGTLIIFQEDIDLKKQQELCSVARAHGYGYSCIELDTKYNRSAMIDVLNDWGWCGSQNRLPVWYKESESEEDAG
jgi:hypothetical protein